ncbi:hypothetical protein PIGHUM_02374 [Pigmentiphaga humi]|uniref:DUF1838 domain-containing protein n=1 Tax=Pigmentiphaga humi TaxID=2478468 RepID=A0A3P4B563_9BURK|nr:DUF1838 family protein [Pigmentiphaga humi]VCU70305.1 hypothetical protein PIGHUM_02374 [Pigmentiphaga humi]
MKTCPASPADLDLAQPSDALAALRKLFCSTVDAKPVVYHWSGQAWARREGEPDRLLFKVEGMNIRQCGTLQDAERGTGFRLVSRELMLYLDPLSGEPLETWRNPWTGAEVPVMHVANDPVNMPPFFERDSQGRPFPSPFRVQGERVFARSEIPLFYPNPLAGDYQEHVGNHYHAMEIFDFVADRARLLDRHADTGDAALAWVRIAPWLPFMKMGSRPGLMVFNAMGQTVESIDALPAVLRDAIANHYPSYAAPPPLDDNRPNATSWTVARQAIDADRRAAPAVPAQPGR